MKTLRRGGSGADLGPREIKAFLEELIESVDAEFGKPSRVLIVPPDQTRIHSRAGALTSDLVGLLGHMVKAILPATGTHRAMDKADIQSMFPGVDPGLFIRHDHRKAVTGLGEIEAAFVERISGGRLHFAFPGEYASALVEGGWDLVLSLGQVVPHEVIGMANYTKNLAVGLGGSLSIDYSHWLGAVCGLEGIMGRAETPVRTLLDESARRFLSKLPVVYVLTVLSRAEKGRLALRGLFAGMGPGSGPEEGLAFREAAELSAAVNIETLERPLRTCVVSLDANEYRSTWLGNKAVYRTRMAIADGGELFILAPGVERFGEDAGIDALVRKHGYRGTDSVLAGVEKDPGLRANLAAAAHLVHGSSEGRFRITYCTGRLSSAEVEGAGYSWMDPHAAESRFAASAASEGWNRSPGGEDYFFISNPALGLWKRADT